ENLEAEPPNHQRRLCLAGTKSKSKIQIIKPNSLKAHIFWRLVSATGASTRKISVEIYPCSKKICAEKEFGWGTCALFWIC
ncbi:MAG: hypothetical protein AAB952_00710, partial [Patescibacteria group bacterium]